MGHSVFISYAREVSREHAEALHKALSEREVLAFLDTSDIRLGEPFPPAIMDALHGSQVVVLFASKEYFQRQYCLWELDIALGPFLALGPGASDVKKQAALASIVVALPADGRLGGEFRSLPPALQAVNWPKANEVQRLADLVFMKLGEVTQTVTRPLEAVKQPGVVASLQHLEEISLPPPRNLAEVPVYARVLRPSLGRSFVGRADDLWRIHYTLSVLRGLRGAGAKGAALTCVLHGAGGFGKSRLALEYLYRYGPEYHPGGLFWVDANADASTPQLQEQFYGILRALKPDVPDLVFLQQSNRNVKQELAEALESISDQTPVLYVVDNVPEPEPKEPPKPLETWCPAIGKVSLLVTTRAKGNLGEGVHEQPVLTLPRDAAVALLTEGLAAGLLAEASWQRISEWVGHLPLALELLNWHMKEAGFDPKDLLSRAESQGPAHELDQQREAFKHHLQADSLRGVAETFSISYKRLSRTEKRAARLIAQLAPNPIPTRLLDALGPKELPAGARVTLRLRHFVTAVEAAGEVSLFGSMHRVLADYLRGRSRDPLAELRQVSRGFSVLMKPSSCRDPREWPLLRVCLPHAESIFERLLERRSRSGEETVGSEELRLGLDLGLFLSAIGYSAQARKIEQRVVDTAMNALGPKDPITLVAMSNLAETARAQGDLGEARKLQEEVLEVRRHVLEAEHPDTLTAMNNLAGTLQAQGDLEGARALQAQVLEVNHRTLGEEHPDTLLAMNNLAETLHEQGNFQEARKKQERVLTLRMQRLGEEDPDTLRAMNNLARTLLAQGEMKEARELQERVLALRNRVLGEEHPDTLTAENNLAGAFHKQGDLQEARRRQEHVLAVSRRVLGEEHPDTLTARNNLAETLREQGDPQAAYVQQERVLEARRRVLGVEHPDTLIAMSNLAETLRAQGKLEEARVQQEQALEVSRRVLGEEHPNTLVMMGNLAATLQEQRNLQGVRVLRERVLEVSRRVLGEEHPDTLGAMSNLAATLQEQGNLQEARVQQEQVLQVSRRVLGEEHPDTLIAMSNLARTLYLEGNLEGARQKQERILEVRLRTLSEDHPATLRTLTNLAATLREQGDLEGARRKQERVLEVSRRVLGEEHPDTLRAMSNLAGTLYLAGDLEGAREKRARVLEVRRRVLGKNHPDTLLSMESLAMTLRQQGDLLGAEALEKEVRESGPPPG